VCGRLRAKETDLTACEKKLMSAESQVNELQARLNDAVNQRRHWEDEYNVCSFFPLTYASVQLLCLNNEVSKH